MKNEIVRASESEIDFFPSTVTRLTVFTLTPHASVVLSWAWWKKLATSGFDESYDNYTC